MKEAQRQIKSLVDRFIRAEKALEERCFLAPVVRGGRVCVWLSGLVCTFRLEAQSFEGWAILRPAGAGRARFEREASAAQVERYLTQLERFRLLLARRLRGRSWLAYPANESDMHQRLGSLAPVAVHLVDGVDAFEQVVSRFDGRSFWFQRLDRGADPRPAAYLRRSLGTVTRQEQLAAGGLTPEMRVAYGLALYESRPAAAGSRYVRRASLEEERHRGTEERSRMVRRREVDRLQQALEWAGGRLDDVRDREDAWVVTWRSSRGEVYSSIIRKDDLGVVAAGICLDERDEDFDVRSLVSVMDEAERSGFAGW